LTLDVGRRPALLGANSQALIVLERCLCLFLESIAMQHVHWI
jgi:hypothetical protein